MPTKNESAGIARVVREIPRRVAGKKVDVYVIDKSTDNTAEIARRAGAIVVGQESVGKGNAMIEAFERIRAKVFVFIDGDNTYDAKSLERLVAPILKGEADMTVANRLVDMEPGAITTFNRFGNFVFNKLVRTFYKQEIRDMLSGYRAIRGDKAKELNLITPGFEIETELTIEALEKGLRVKEIPIHFKKRAGVTKLHPLKDGARIFKTVLFMLRDTKPLYFFSVLGGASLILSLWPTSLIVYEKIAFGEVRHIPSTVFSAFTILLGIQLITLGLLADMIKTKTQKLEKSLKKA